MKIILYPSVYEYALAASVKASNKTLFPYELNKTRPNFLEPKISPIVLSSNGTTRGL